eukprot:gnl/TRDRNA2_/TRDRNA2_126499_c0_seq1.p1 gnl/TRDRNA2_/TRDRNA2_126499_c0~~gnl/TRDRNA2_/TRDRNA2_126499_c0_seq1.p1  ORF type:complete len:533 (+),score=83.20 gnl/TRDRNA2_/TRDRNA2_126499_c0_seq1:47-1600(+)
MEVGVDGLRPVGRTGQEEISMSDDPMLYAEHSKYVREWLVRVADDVAWLRHAAAQGKSRGTVRRSSPEPHEICACSEAELQQQFHDAQLQLGAFADSLCRLRRRRDAKVREEQVALCPSDVMDAISSSCGSHQSSCSSSNGAEERAGLKAEDPDETDAVGCSEKQTRLPLGGSLAAAQQRALDGVKRLEKLRKKIQLAREDTVREVTAEDSSICSGAETRDSGTCSSIKAPPPGTPPEEAATQVGDSCPDDSPWHMSKKQTLSVCSSDASGSTRATAGPTTGPSLDLMSQGSVHTLEPEASLEDAEAVVAVQPTKLQPQLARLPDNAPENLETRSTAAKEATPERWNSGGDRARSPPAPTGCSRQSLTAQWVAAPRASSAHGSGTKLAPPKSMSAFSKSSCASSRAPSSNSRTAGTPRAPTLTPPRPREAAYTPLPPGSSSTRSSSNRSSSNTRMSSMASRCRSPAPACQTPQRHQGEPRVVTRFVRSPPPSPLQPAPALRRLPQVSVSAHTCWLPV